MLIGSHSTEVIYLYSKWQQGHLDLKDCLNLHSKFLFFPPSPTAHTISCFTKSLLVPSDHLSKTYYNIFDVVTRWLSAHIIDHLVYLCFTEHLLYSRHPGCRSKKQATQFFFGLFFSPQYFSFEILYFSLRLLKQKNSWLIIQPFSYFTVPQSWWD